MHSENFCRTHFPVVLESSNSQWWSHEVYHRMNVESHHMPAVDTYQPNAAQIDAYYVNNAPNADLEGAMRYLVMAGSEYRRVKSVAKERPSAQEVADRLLRKERNTFMHRLYRSMNSERLVELRDSEPKVYWAKIFDFMRKMSLERNKLGLWASTNSLAHLYDDLLIASLASHRVLYFKRSVSLISPENVVYCLFMREYLASVRHRLPRFIGKQVIEEGYHFPNYIYDLGRKRNELLESERHMAGDIVNDYHNDWQSFKSAVKKTIF